MKALVLVATAAVLAVAVAAAAWFLRDSPALATARRAVGLTPEPPATLQAAGVHKCVGSRGTVYTDGPCAAGGREVAASGGTVTVMSFPKPAPAAASSASGLLGGPLVRPTDPDERDRLRDKAIDDAANRK
jgi:hypothetical protein